MKAYYRVHSVVFKIVHKKDKLFKWLHDEIKYYQLMEPGSSFDCLLTLRPGRRKFTLPKKAVFSSADEKGRFMYTLGNLLFILKDKEFLISVDYHNEEITVDYAKPQKEIYEIVRAMVKWGFIKSAEEKRMAYIHASAVHYKNKNIIFTGDTNNGKSSCAMRLLRAGATLITDDSILIDGDALIPFTFKTAVDKDFAKRFKVKQEFLDMGSRSEETKTYQGIDICIFLHIWNSETSKAVDISYEQALLKLIRIYKKEVRITTWHNWDKNMAENSKLVFEKYSELLKKARPIEFYAGHNEQEVRKSLLDCIKKRSNTKT
ncbi:MAG: hypothetical protein PHS53_02445 [Candidatus Pacebacteria bacterium]|nr:hypothetical protein [Candidatus Paceibacterota bacterium]MDD5356983.1 hypothetical protein [Candidatus Paceibacterota bacterium]